MINETRSGPFAETPTIAPSPGKETEVKESTPPRKLRLALSGGGFRATLFHLGVMRSLLEADRLKDVTHIASVSGGSVLAAHIVLNWEKFKADAGQFEEVSKDLLDFIRSDVRNAILRKLPILLGQRLFTKSEQSATHELERLYQGFYHNATLKNLAAPGRPHLAILGTNVGQARLCWFTSDGFAVLQTSGNEPEIVGKGVIDVAEAVAASSAFPMLFPPKRFDRDQIRYEDPSKYQYVTDAGVYDNLALSCFLIDPLTGAMGVFADSKGTVLVSDATATIDWDSEQRPSFVQNLFRSIDIIHQRSSDLLRQKARLIRRDTAKGNYGTKLQPTEEGLPPDYVLIDIEEDRLHTAPCIADSLQKHLSYLRTDLDAFSECEIHFLVQHGYCVGWHILKEYCLISPGRNQKFDEWAKVWPSPKAARLQEREAVNFLSKGTARTYDWFAWGDPNSRLLSRIAIYICLVCLALGFGIHKMSSNRLKAERADILRQRPQLSENERKRQAIALIDHYQRNPIRKVTKPSGKFPPAPLLPPDYTGFQITSLEKIFDLREWQDTQQTNSSSAVEEYAHMQTTYLIQRPELRRSIVFQIKTSGKEVWPWIEASFPATMYQLSEDNADRYFPKRWQIDVVIDQQPPHRVFSLTAGGTYINAFQKGHLDAAFKAYTDSEVATVIILFPKQKRATNLRYFSTSDDQQMRVYLPHASFAVEHDHGLYFEIANPRAPKSYGVEWDWAPPLPSTIIAL